MTSYFVASLLVHMFKEVSEACREMSLLSAAAPCVRRCAPCWSGMSNLRTHGVQPLETDGLGGGGREVF